MNKFKEQIEMELITQQANDNTFNILTGKITMDELFESNQHGIDKDKTRDPDMIRHIIEETMFYFEELEEYEKCAELKREIESFKQDNFT